MKYNKLPGFTTKHPLYRRKSLDIAGNSKNYNFVVSTKLIFPVKYIERQLEACTLCRTCESPVTRLYEQNVLFLRAPSTWLQGRCARIVSPPIIRVPSESVGVRLFSQPSPFSNSATDSFLLP